MIKINELYEKLAKADQGATDWQIAGRMKSVYQERRRDRLRHPGRPQLHQGAPRDNRGRASRDAQWR